MKKICIIGAGQSGLLLAIGLLRHNYKVTLISNKSSDDFVDGYILSNQALFDTGLCFERNLGLNHWENVCPKNNMVSFCISGENHDDKLIQWKGVLPKPFQSVDQRLKFSTWLNDFVKMRGKLCISEVTARTIYELSETYDLVIVSTGKGVLSALFETDWAKTKYNAPQRYLTCLYVTGMTPNPEPGICVNIIPGLGEYFTLPGLGLHGECEMMLYESVIGGELNRWSERLANEALITAAKKILKQYLPWEGERCQNIQLSDNKSFLKGAYQPIIRKPIAKLKSGKLIFGMGDAIVLNDPIAGQGANSATRCAKIYLDAILDHDDEIFDEAWMLSTYHTFWEHAELATKWSNLLLEPPKPHVIDLFKCAENNQYAANILSNAFDNLDTIFPWIEHSDATRDKIEYFNTLQKEGV